MKSIEPIMVGFGESIGSQESGVGAGIGREEYEGYEEYDGL